LARVLRPGRAIPPDLRNYATQIPDMGATTCAVVDFDSTDSAHECCRGLRDKNLRGMRIALLGPRIRRTLYKAEKKKIPENRHQRRMNTIHQQKNVKPTPDDPSEFPPLGGPAEFHPFQQMANPMAGMPIGPKSMVQTTKWGPPSANASKPTMSQIVAQNVAQAVQAVHEMSEHGEFSDNSSESGLSSPKPANCSVTPIKHVTKQFKGWNLNTETTDQISKHNYSNIQNDASGWCPWSTTNFSPAGADVGPDALELLRELRDEDDEWTNDDEEKPRLQTPIDFTFDPIPSLAIGAGIWSTTTAGESGW